MTGATLVYVGVGSNLGNPIEQVSMAIRTMVQSEHINSLKSSSLYRSSPMGGMKQPDYINAVVSFHTDLAALDLLDLLQQLEKNQGRQRTEVRWSARTLDLDLLLYGKQEITLERLTLPHPGIYDRNFVIKPLAELDPELRLPDNTHISYLLAETSEEGLEKIE